MHIQVCLNGCTNLSKMSFSDIFAIYGNGTDGAKRTYIGMFERMFAGCTSLTDAPALPALTVYESSYEGMFSGCTSLITAPTLLGTGTANKNAYKNMFNGCTRLSVIPTILQSTTLNEGCYAGMFKNCTLLTNNNIFTDKSLKMFSNALSGMFERMYCVRINSCIL